ncbi:MAG: hypothetical protein HQM07_02275 [Zetaproteobacteria bacterium]|nr:hypothetical protein [Zetaproteobacteria bacterium]
MHKRRYALYGGLVGFIFGTGIGVAVYGGIFGLLFGAAVGAMIGFTVMHWVSASDKNPLSKYSKEQGEIFIALVTTMLGKVVRMHGEGGLAKESLAKQYVRDSIAMHLGGEELVVFDDAIAHFFNASDESDIYEDAKAFRTAFVDKTLRKKIYKQLFEVAVAEGYLTQTSEIVLLELARSLGIFSMEYEALKNDFLLNQHPSQK